MALELKRASSASLERCDLSGATAVRAGDGCRAALSGCWVGGATQAEADGSISTAAPSPQAWGPPRLPVSAQPENPSDHEDREFRWYDRRKQAGTLVGTASV